MTIWRDSPEVGADIGLHVKISNRRVGGFNRRRIVVSLPILRRGSEPDNPGLD